MFCKNCGKQIDENASFCPSCGTPVQKDPEKPQTLYEMHKSSKGKKPLFKKWWFWVIVVILLIAIVQSFGNKADTNSNDDTVSTGGNTTATTQNEVSTKNTETTPTTVPETTIDPAVAEAEYRDSCQAVDYKDLCRYPDNYVGTKIYVEVKIYQIMDVGGLFGNQTAWRGLTDNSGYDFYTDDEYYLLDKRPDGAVKVLKDDIVVIYGEFTGLEKVTRALTLTQEEIPSINVRYVDIIE